ncbi:MAG: hypothetical protein LUC92_06730 [Clostridiales bacterium]|nr:hypothetical protein [Clostridiales bacterium]
MKKTYSKPVINVTSLKSDNAIATDLTSGDVQATPTTLKYSNISNY